MKAMGRWRQEARRASVALLSHAVKLFCTTCLKQRAAILIWSASRTLDKSCRSAGKQQAGICWCLLPARAFCSFCSHTCLCIFELCVCMWGAQPSPKWRCWKWRAKHQGKNHTRVSSVCFSWLGSARLGLRNLLRRLNVHPSPVTQRWGRCVFWWEVRGRGWRRRGGGRKWFWASLGWGNAPISHEEESSEYCSLVNLYSTLLFLGCGGLRLGLSYLQPDDWFRIVKMWSQHRVYLSWVHW